MESVTLKTKNQLYKESGERIPYAQWLAKERVLWQQRLASGSTRLSNFEEFLNHRYNWKRQHPQAEKTAPKTTDNFQEIVDNISFDKSQDKLSADGDTPTTAPADTTQTTSTPADKDGFFKSLGKNLINEQLDTLNKQTATPAKPSTATDNKSGVKNASVPDDKTKKKNILGLSPAIFYTVTGVLLLGIGVTVFVLLKPKKQGTNELKS